MKIVIVVFFCLVCMLQSDDVNAQRKVDIVKFDWYKDLRNLDNDTTYVLNFWASWCLPCIHELPEFEKLTQAFRGKAVKVILVNLDSYKKLQITIMPFLDQQKVSSEVVVLDEPNFKQWIHKVDRSWGGSIPATILFNHQTKFARFVEGEIGFDELTSIVESSR